jgi:translation initiation factor 2B subunit (eIF-2B alpha/beta/delta family)
MTDPNGEETGVVTVLLRHGSDVLLLRRSDAVGAYGGRWGAVAGHAESDPERLAREEVREETGTDPGRLSFVRRGPAFPVEDPDHGVRRVHPFLFDCPTRAVTTDRETTEYEWVQPTAILGRGTVPELWESYRRVAPTGAAVREDREHGSEYVSRRAVEVLRDAGAALAAGVDAPGEIPGGDGDDWSRLTALAERLLTARESMVVVANRVRRVLAAAAADHTAAAAREAAESLLDGLDDASIAVPDSLRGATVATLSRSGTVRDLLARCEPGAVVVAESRPGGEGRAVAGELAAGLDAPVTLCADAGVAHALDARDVDAVLVGADTVLADGRVVNKVGTRTLAAAAAAVGVPVHVAAHTDKVAPPGHAPDLEPRAPAELLGDDPPDGLDAEHPAFDVTPPELVGGYLTEAGALDADTVGRVAREAATRWDGRQR